MPPIRKNGCGKQLPQPKTHTTPADRQAMTTHRAERYANFPRKAQRTGRSAPPNTMSCRSSAGNQVHPLNSSLVFFLSYHTCRKKATPSFPRGPISFLPDSEEEQHNYQNKGEGAITFSLNVCGLKRTWYKASMGLFFGCCGRWTFLCLGRNFKKSVEKLIKICHTKIMHLRGKELCTICAAK